MKSSKGHLKLVCLFIKHRILKSYSDTSKMFFKSDSTGNKDLSLGNWMLSGKLDALAEINMKL
jgi:hypothetical protein